MLILSIILGFLVVVKAGPATEIASYKGQFCTDPRTMRRHAAYTEWADAYSCTRHRCQPGGRNLAIYTVGCKRVEAPESAIECEEVVEDTNMQFPYCCTRLRCLVVVRGEVWTRVLGQPWETLPAAPWSHMYKMKKPPPGSEGSFMPKPEEGPVYELQSPEATEQSSDDKVLRSEKKPEAECNDGATRVIAGPPPDIVIALSTGSEKGLGRKNRELDENNKLKRRENRNNNVKVFEEAEPETRNQDYPPTKTEKEKVPLAIRRKRRKRKEETKAKTPEPLSEERYGGSYLPEKQQQASLEPEEQQQETEAPQPLWNDHDQQPENDQANQHGNDWEERERKRREPVSESLTMPSESPFMNKIEPTQNWETQPPAEPDFVPPHIQKEMRRSEDKEGGKVEHSGSLQALVDAIGTRMRDIETVVAKMNEKVQNEKAEIADKGLPISTSMNEEIKYYDGQKKTKKSASNSEHYKRGGSKYVHGSGDYTTEPPLFVEDSNLNGYFNDASNNVIRRAPKEPAETMTYMAPVPEVKSRRKLSYNEPNEHESKRKKRVHKKKHMKSHHKKHHGKEDKRRKFRVNSVEKGAVSLEDSSAGNAGMNINNGTFDNMID